ncbi:type I-E CRISPR-associated protein Cas5/CasD [Brooklawnia sp.]|uniref:type I-E CRISPR-associated protein Cas5/CasD n=1 Tax=Brooklawnia sp. TaxID=2699740 RepID=UPI00311D2E1F
MNDECIALRLAGPLQSWGDASQFNQRRTSSTPTKSGVVGLLAAALGRRRPDPIEDLVALRMGVRSDQPGSLLRDYHTVSDRPETPLLSANVDAKGRQKRTSPKKFTQPTHRYYLEDAVFVAVLQGDPGFLESLATALRHPIFPLALGRRSCVPTQPLVLGIAGEDLWQGQLPDIIGRVPWQSASHARSRVKSATVRLAASWDDPEGGTIKSDVPVSFDPRYRGMRTRKVHSGWVDLPTGLVPEPGNDSPKSGHDPFELLGW